VTAAADTEPAAPDASRAACSPCRGTGVVVSNLGGEASTEPCPWCEGSGMFLAEHDAQAARRAVAASA
jgi:DnaJ-class molecular chaperone